MSRGVPNILQAIRTATWAIVPSKLDAIVEFVEFYAAGGRRTAEELSAMGISTGPRPSPRVNGQVAVLPLQGVIGHHMGMEMQISGGTSTEAFARAFDEAMNTPDVGAIVFDTDSPGGAVEGVPELAARIFNARGKGKRIIAVSNAHMNSAAYWVASAADEIVCTQSGEVGSIGVFTVHTDTSALEAREGVKRTVVAYPAEKAEAAPGVPLTDDAHAALDARVGGCYEMFASDVAKHRGVSLAAVKSGFGKGRCVSAKDALAAGMIDRIATLETVLAELTGRSGSAAFARAAQTPAQLTAASGRPSARPAQTPRLLATAMTCPECGAAMDEQQDGSFICHECGDTEDAPTTTDPSPAARARAPQAAAPTTPATKQAPQARSVSVTPEELAAERAALIQAETTRQNEIRALCAEHSIDDATRDGWLSNGVTYEAAAAQTMKLNRTRRAADPTIRVGADRETQKPWETLGHFAAAVMNAGTPGATSLDPRLHAAAQGQNQAIPSEGGFVVPPVFSTKIWDEQAGDVDDLLGMTDNYPIDGESLTMNANAETSRATGSRFGGVQGYWINEADQVTKSKAKFRAMRLEPQELGVLIYATDKTLRNSPVALSTYLQRAASEEIKFLSGAAIYGGTGAGQPLGLMNSGSLITVNKETSQAAATIQQENISKMWARLHPRARAGASWFMNVDCEPQLDFLNTVVKNVAGSENVGGYANKVYDPEKRTIKGRPIVTVEFAETLGTKGDFVLANFGWYASATRSTGLRSDTSIHLRFDYNETAFRFMYELDGQPWLASALTPFKGSNTLSWAVALQTR